MAAGTNILIYSGFCQALTLSGMLQLKTSQSGEKYAIKAWRTSDVPAVGVKKTKVEYQCR